jgi:hypothetical protein
MFDLLSSLGSWVKRQEITTDNAIFRLHYMFTSLMLLTFSVIITANQFLGDPIDCMGDKSVPGNVANTYCWITSTFTMPDAHKGEIGVDVPHPGGYTRMIAAMDYGY